MFQRRWISPQMPRGRTSENMTAIAPRPTRYQTPLAPNHVSMAKKMIDWVKEGRRTPDEAVTYMQRFCSCGVFNPSRAKRILEEARSSQR